MRFKTSKPTLSTPSKTTNIPGAIRSVTHGGSQEILADDGTTYLSHGPAINPRLGVGDRVIVTVYGPAKHGYVIDVVRWSAGMMG